jgi:hypothetical protein
VPARGADGLLERCSKRRLRDPARFPITGVPPIRRRARHGADSIPATFIVTRTVATALVSSPPWSLASEDRLPQATAAGS